MNKNLESRACGKCELCGSEGELQAYSVSGTNAEDIALCTTCVESIDEPLLNANHWRCLGESIWSSIPAVQVASYRTLKKLSDEGESWASDILEMAYLEPEVLAWANEGIESQESSEPTKDSNGTILNEGDSVTIIKDLEVKGAGFTAKQGTKVTNIHLTSNPEQIEGRVNGVKIVLLSKFLKKV
jgi:protein PhnA